MPISAELSIGRLVAETPAAARVLERYGLDYCCAGRRTLRDACAAGGLVVEDLIADLDAVAANDPGSARDWLSAPLAELADHIEHTHHSYLRAELPRLSAIIAKVSQAHGERRPELIALTKAFEAFRSELEDHMTKEERVLFPRIRRLERGGEGFPRGGIRGPISCMEHEHENAGKALAEFRRLTNSYEPPSAACATYLVMLHALRDLEQDMHAHVHKENSVLFPRAITLEQNLGQSKSDG